MAPAATIQKSNSAVGFTTSTTTPQHVPFQSKLLGASAKSKFLLAEPSTNKARRIIAKNTSWLIEKRKEVDECLRYEAKRSGKRKSTDYRALAHYVQLDNALARREARHLRACTKALEERQRLYKLDPSTERQIYVDLLSDYLFKFKRHLGSSLAERERPLKPGEHHDDSSSASSSGDGDPSMKPDEPNDESNAKSKSISSDNNNDNEAHDSADVPSSASANLAAIGVKDNNSDHASDERAPDYQSTDGDKDPSCANVDGSFDDYVRLQKKSNKRKIVDGQTGLTAEQGQRKKSKKAQKEQAATKADVTATLESQSLRSNVCKLISSEEDDNSGNQASIHSMPQSKKLPSITLNDEHAVHDSEANNNNNTAIGDKNITDSTTSDKISLPKPSNDLSSRSSIQTNSTRGGTDAELPWYQLHARRQLEDNFNDCVLERPPTARRGQRWQPRKQSMYGKEMPEIMGGALVTPPRRLASGDLHLVSGGLPSPETSLSPPTHSPAAGNKPPTASKPQGANLRKAGRRKTRPRQGRPTSISPSISRMNSSSDKAANQMTRN